MDEPAPKTESKVEGLKKGSRHLRGTIHETITSDATHFTDEDATLGITSNCTPSVCAPLLQGVQARPRTFGVRFSQDF